MHRNGEVEVITIDVNLANQVRCHNASLAQDVAKLLNIPVKRVHVTPWSWTKEIEQSNYLAFVQEDHERCDCISASGHLLAGAGFRKIQRPSEGAAADADKSVMTLSEYKAMMAAADAEKRAEEAAAKVRKEAAARKQAAFDAAEAGPPPARVQMLTRDPCLVELLQTQTSYFQKSLAFYLAVPEDKLLINPPPVRGTVGLLQLSHSVQTRSTRDPNTPVLAIQHCGRAEVSELAERLHSSALLQASTSSLDAAIQADSTAAAASPAPSLAPSPAIFEVAGSGSADKVVLVSMELSNINYDRVASNWTLVSEVSAAIKKAIASAGHVPPGRVKVSLLPGSLVVEAEVEPPAGTEADAVLAFLEGSACKEAALEANKLQFPEGRTGGPIGCSVLKLAAEARRVTDEETNRPWVAFWSVVILQPFSEDAAWNLLNLVNTDTTEVSKLLPLTLARVPGLSYQSIREPNAANETRLPPPEDKAVGFALPTSREDQLAMKLKAKRQAEAERLRRSTTSVAVGEKVERRDNGGTWGTGFVTSMVPLKVSVFDDPAAKGYTWDEVRKLPPELPKQPTPAQLAMAAKAAQELADAKDALNNSIQVQDILQQADANFTEAARAHADQLRGQGSVNAPVASPDIVSPEVLDSPDGESPYFAEEEDAEDDDGDSSF